MLSSLQVDPERLKSEQKLLSYYEFFFTEGTPDLLARTSRLIYDRILEKAEGRVPLFDEGAQKSADGRSDQETRSLGYLARALLQLDLSPRDLLL